MANLLYWLLLILISLLISHLHNWEKTSLLIARKLPSGKSLPPLGPVDSLVRDGSKERFKIYFLLFFLFLGYSLFFMRWYWTLVSPPILFLGVVLVGTFLPDYNSRFYRNMALDKLRKLKARQERSGNLRESKLIDDLIECVGQLKWPVYQPSGQTGPLTSLEQEIAANYTVYLVWYDDRFEWFEEEPSSFLAGVCATREEADKMVSRRPLSDPETFDGYEYYGPSNLLEDYLRRFVSAEQVREILNGNLRSGPNYYLPDKSG